MDHRPEVRISKQIEPHSAGKTWVFKGAIDADALELHLATRIWAKILSSYSPNQLSLTDQIPSAAVDEVQALAQRVVDRDGPPSDGVLVILEPAD
ncbi:hypothetical protein HNP52_002185 [Sphingomonas kyeonggiensis]|uniref:Uncharacterized protein n=1 Tax=Sphingomonas kyeonggiensis TaxID=1268553 RepID=A0A7W7NST2_9SPHN|nr:hypothetical protein [Sphingomonas kyeonggiensis]MBB4839116.1 hypothetical protein [Sphingomonas kyeonggiensis]